MHIMIDLETMGTRPNAPIIAIGAVAFDAETIHDEFYSVVDLADAVAEGAVMSPDTVLWWLKQSDAARAAFDRPGDPLGLTLGAFREWITKFNLDGVWGNGASFDNTILSEAYQRIGTSAPWPFWKDRCYRTMKNVHPGVQMERAGTHHNALDDAKTQALHLMRINEEFGRFL